MKVGILTFHHTVNYGATLQAYALWTTIKRLGHDVELIDYRPYGAVRFYLREIQPIRLNKRSPINYDALKHLLKSWKMRKFLISKMQLSNRKYYRKAGLESFHQHYDIVVCGSDQIWCVDTPFRGFDASFFLNFVCKQTTRKVSYAASFGNTTDLGKYKELIHQLINQFDAISVRDSNSLQLIQNNLGQQATKVLDPTFLISYDEIISVPSLKEDYLLIYNQNLIKLEEWEYIKLVAKIKNLDIVCIGKPQKLALKNYTDIGPEEWLGFFSKASYIITNTYHGTIFSLIFKKPFTVIFQGNKLEKINDLLRQVGLEERILPNPVTNTSVAEASLDINYDSVSKKLEKEISKSKNFLLKSLEEKQTYSN